MTRRRCGPAPALRGSARRPRPGGSALHQPAAARSGGVRVARDDRPSRACGHGLAQGLHHLLTGIPAREHRAAAGSSSSSSTEAGRAAPVEPRRSLSTAPSHSRRTPPHGTTAALMNPLRRDLLVHDPQGRHHLVESIPMGDQHLVREVRTATAPPWPCARGGACGGTPPSDRAPRSAPGRYRPTLAALLASAEEVDHAAPPDHVHREIPHLRPTHRLDGHVDPAAPPRSAPARPPTGSSTDRSVHHRGRPHAPGRFQLVVVALHRDDPGAPMRRRVDHHQADGAEAHHAHGGPGRPRRPPPAP